MYLLLSKTYFNEKIEFNHCCITAKNTVIAGRCDARMACYMLMQTDGNLVIYNAATNDAVWSTDTFNRAFIHGAVWSDTDNKIEIK